MKTLILLTIILTGCGYDDVTLDAGHYKSMVCDGYYPNYKHIELDCTVPSARGDRYVF